MLQPTEPPGQGQICALTEIARAPALISWHTFPVRSSQITLEHFFPHYSRAGLESTMLGKWPAGHVGGWRGGYLLGTDHQRNHEKIGALGGGEEKEFFIC